MQREHAPAIFINPGSRTGFRCFFPSCKFHSMVSCRQLGKKSEISNKYYPSEEEKTPHSIRIDTPKQTNWVFIAAHTVLSFVVILRLIIFPVSIIKREKMAFTQYRFRSRVRSCIYWVQAKTFLKLYHTVWILRYLRSDHFILILHSRLNVYINYSGILSI